MLFGKLEAADEPLTDRRHDLASTPHLAQTHAVWQIGESYNLPRPF